MYFLITHVDKKICKKICKVAKTIIPNQSYSVTRQRFLVGKLFKEKNTTKVRDPWGLVESLNSDQRIVISIPRLRTRNVAPLMHV